MTQKTSGPCSHKDTCALFPKITAQASLSIWHRLYCDGDYTRCERYKVSLKGEEPSIRMLPNGNLLPTLGEK